jgi:hypothetical protein
MNAIKEPSASAARQELIALIEDLVSKDPFTFEGHAWAARPQSFWCEQIHVSTKTLGRYITEPPIVRRRKVVEGKLMSLLRIGEPPPKDANEYARILRGVWRNKTGMDAPADDEGRQQWEHWKRCLWGYVKDVMANPAVQAFTDEPGELAVAAFKHALDCWQMVAAGIKIAAEARPNYKPRFWDYPNIPIIRSFHTTVVHAYVMKLMEDNKIAGNELNAAAALLNATDPFEGHPGDDTTLDEMVKLKAWPIKDQWKPQPATGAVTI